MQPKIIDNKRQILSDTLSGLAKSHDHLSIATGYWDLPGMLILFEQIKNYTSIRLLIGQEPLAPRFAKQLDINEPEKSFPEQDMVADTALLEQKEEYRKLVTGIKELIETGKLSVRVYRRNFMHAKCYIFGDYSSTEAVGVIGSSNFTRAGLQTNAELNSLEDDHRIVKFQPTNDTDEYGHLSWFESVWNDELTEKWNGKFIEVLENSPVGDLTYSAYDMYIRTLWELYQDEIIDDESLALDESNVLFTFQQRNAQLLLKKLNKYGLAMLADSVGLGKTITAGAVMKHYRETKDSRRIYVIAPASLCDQWRTELLEMHQLLPSDFEVISMQDKNSILKAREIDKYAPVDMFVIDEAHNLRNDASKRHQELLEWFTNNQESKVLLLTATPINNSLTDFVNQIQLANKGSLESFPVVYPTTKKNEVIDFFEAVKRLASEMKQAENKGERPDFDKVNRIMKQGLRHFLVRTTRAGIEKEGGLLGGDGVMRTFPKSDVKPAPYKFSQELAQGVNNVINNNAAIFGGHDPRRLDVDSLLEQTQRTKHPLDLLNNIAVTRSDYTQNVFVNVFQILLLLGFSPYRSETYQHRFYGQTPEQIRSFKLKPEESFALQSQMSVHNMLRVTLLKRLESSQFALMQSLENYTKRLDKFTEYLNRGSIVKFKDLQNIQNEFGDDLELVMEHNEITDKDDQIELIPADRDKYNIDALLADIEKDRALLLVLTAVCQALNDNDDKLKAFSELLTNIISDHKAGGKVLVFSYYSDTIKYLSEKLPGLIDIKDFGVKSAFVSGDTKSHITETVKRFSPKSKGGNFNPEEQLDYLFATDVLSEGQNLQDCGTLINFDLHWNPVRMIQRNGRINRLGSEHEQVYIYNMHPETNLESYLKLVQRLEQKIDRIKYTVGTDQSILGEEENPIEYIDDIEENTKSENIALNLYDKDKANQATEELQKDDEDFLSLDEYILDLRRFQRDGSKEDKERIQKIPLGKWGYLPESMTSKTILSLTRARGTTTVTGVDFETQIFVKSDPLENYSTAPIETIEALGYLRTTPEDNQRKKDEIRYERETVKRRVLIIAAKQAIKKQTPFKITPSIVRVLDAVAQNRSDLLLRGALDNIITKQDQRKVKRLFDQANTDLKIHEQLLPGTLIAFEKLVNNLGKHIDDQKEVSITEGLLFYAK